MADLSEKSSLLPRGTPTNVSADHEGSPDEEELDYEPNQLGTLNGVFVPCCLNIMGVVLFLRLSWAVGEAGVLGVFGMLGIAETQAIMTVLSLSAMVSNGKMKGGGSYFMMSRSLGPEFGGAIGILFYIAFSVGTCFYSLGFATEVQLTVFPHNKDPWLVTTIASITLFFVLVVCLGGARYFTKCNVPLFVVQIGATFFGILCIWFRTGGVELEHGGELAVPTWKNFRNNLWPELSENSPQCSGGYCSPHLVFAIIFPAATGIMEGANLSGDLKDPARSIGKGTLMAVSFAILIYVTLILTFATFFSRETLKENVVVLQDAALSRPFMFLGVLFSTGSSALGSVFGGSRVLQALANDRILKGIFFFAKGSAKGNEPRRAVVLTWLIAQCCLFIGDLDVVAPLISSFFCLSYAMTNLACFMLAISGTINFRPHFRYFSKYTALAGFVLNICVMFYLDYVYATVSIIIFILIVFYLFYNAPTAAWGDVRQAIIYHTVRKYLLRLDTAPSCGKLWRPALLLMSNDLTDPLAPFCNLLKKGGFYAIGGLVVGDIGAQKRAERLALHESWQKQVEKDEIKAFVQVALASKAREGYQNLINLSGVGGMCPNTVVFPMYPCRSTTTSPAAGATNLPLRDQQEYLTVLDDCLQSSKHILVCRSFDKLEDLHKGEAEGGWLKKREYHPAHYIDCWFYSDSCTSFNTFADTPLLILSLGYIVVNKSSHVKMRVFCVKSADSSLSPDEEALYVRQEEERLSHNVRETRVDVALLKVVLLRECAVPSTAAVTVNKSFPLSVAALTRGSLMAISTSSSPANGAQDSARDRRGSSSMRESCGISAGRANSLNALMKEHSGDASVIFSELPSGISSCMSPAEAASYMVCMQALTDDLPPTVLVAAGDNQQPVMSFTL